MEKFTIPEKDKKRRLTTKIRVKPDFYYVKVYEEKKLNYCDFIHMRLLKGIYLSYPFFVLYVELIHLSSKVMAIYNETSELLSLAIHERTSCCIPLN